MGMSYIPYVCPPNSSINSAGHSITDRTAADCSTLNSSYVVCSCALAHCPVVEGSLAPTKRCPQGMACCYKMTLVLLPDPFYPVQISHSTINNNKHNHTITLPPPCLMDSFKRPADIFLFVLFLANSSNLKLRFACPKHFFPVFLCLWVCVLLPVLIGQSQIWFSLLPCLEVQHPGVSSPLLTLRLVFCGYNLMKLQVEDL